MNQFQKSTKKIDKLRSSFFLVGLIIACSFTFLAFEWTSTYTIITPKPPTIDIGDDGVLPPITYRNEVKPPEVKIKPPSFNPDEIIIVKEDPIKPEEKPEFVEVNPESFNPDDWTPVEKKIGPPPPPVFIAGVMPHYEDCKTLSEEERRMCTDTKMKSYLSSITHVPEIIKMRGKAEYVAYVYFEVSAKGKVGNVKILNDKKHKIPRELEREAYNAVKSLPQFIPGNNYGKRVAVRYQIPIKFTIK